MVTAATQSTVSGQDAASALFSSLNGAQKTDKTTATESAQNRFLTLLTTQLKNQDPLNPMDNAQVTSQLAQISTVDGIERLNSTLSKLIDGQNQTQTLQAAALVGHGVLVPGNDFRLAGGQAIGGFELGGAADRVTVEIKDANGIVVRSLKFDGTGAGVHSFTWDGKTDAGAQAVDGNYSFAVAATQGGKKVAADKLQLGIVDSISGSGAGLGVNLGSLGRFTMSDIKQIL